MSGLPVYWPPKNIDIDTEQMKQPQEGWKITQPYWG